MGNDFNVETFLEKAQDKSVLFVTFEHKVSEYGDSVVYCFVEDYDMPYYIRPIEKAIDSEYVSIKCKGKKNVLAMHEDFKKHPFYMKYTKRFFVDRDFDDNTSIDDDIYITPCYAIENFYVSDEVLKKILITEYDLDPIEDKKSFDKTLSLYTRIRDDYNEAILFFNAWYACIKNKEGWNKKSVSLGNSFPKNWVTIKWRNYEVVQKYNLHDIEKRYPEAPKLCLEEIRSKISVLRPCLFNNLRGKYEIEYLFLFIQFLNNDGRCSKEYNVKRKNITITKDKAISNLSQYAYIPYDLIEYIKTGKRTT